MSENGRRWIGAAVGLAVGVAVYWLMLRAGYHLLGAVGVGLAIGVALGSRERRVGWGLLTAALAVAACVVVEWAFRPFSADDSFGYFVQHLTDLPQRSQTSLLVVAVLGVYFGVGRRPRKARDAGSKAS